MSVFLEYAPEARAPGADYVAQVRSVGMDKVYGRVHDAADLGLLVFNAAPGVLDSLAALPWIRRIHVDSARVTVTSDQVSWGLQEMAVPTVHATGVTGSPSIVAIIDGGINCNHPDLSGRVVGGYDFVADSPTYCHTANNRGVNHGTAVAGIIAGVADGQGVLGAAPSTQLYSYRVCDGDGVCSSTHIWLALQAARQVANVANISLGKCGGEAGMYLTAQIQAFWQVGGISVWSAGNGVDADYDCGCEDAVSGFATAPYAVGVAAHLQNGTYPACYQYGPGVDFSAPTGVVTDSALAPLLRTFWGTSAAAPHVTGAIALMRSWGGFTQYGPQEFVDRLAISAIDAGASGYDFYYGHGKPDVYRAVTWLTRISVNGPAAPPNGLATWTAGYAGGVAPMTFQWQKSEGEGVGPWVTVGSSSSYSRNITAQSCFMLRLTVSSSAYGQSGQATLQVKGAQPICLE